MPDDSVDCYGVDAASSPCFAIRGFPDARLACLVLPGDFLKFNPFCFAGGEGFDLEDLGGLRHVVRCGEVESGVEGAWWAESLVLGDEGLEEALGAVGNWGFEH